MDLHCIWILLINRVQDTSPPFKPPDVTELQAILAILRQCDMFFSDQLDTYAVITPSVPSS